MTREPETAAGRSLVREIPEDADGYIDAGQVEAAVLAIEAELRRSLAEKVRTLPWNVAGQATAPIGGCDEEWAVGEYQSAVLALIEGTDPASPRDIMDTTVSTEEWRAVNRGIAERGAGRPMTDPASQEDRHDLIATLAVAAAAADSLPPEPSPPAGSTIPPLDVERLARAIASFVYQSDPCDFDRNVARGVAAEYARLARSTEPATEEPR